MAKNIFNKILLIILTTTFIISLIKIILYTIESPKNKNIYKEIKNNVEIQKNIIEEKINIEDENIEDTTTYSINISKLKKINIETIGWLKVSGTNVDYPIVQTNDNNYYLSHAFNKTKNSAGTIFVDYRNNILDDKNTIIYGHNRKDKTMFATLKITLTKKWYQNKKNRLINLTLEDKDTIWQIFSIYTIETTNDYLKINFSNDNEFENFIKLIKDRSELDFKTNVSNDDKILTLSTCHKNSKKLVIHAKLIKIEEK